MKRAADDVVCAGPPAGRQGAHDGVTGSEAAPQTQQDRGRRSDRPGIRWAKFRSCCAEAANDAS